MTKSNAYKLSFLDRLFSLKTDFQIMTEQHFPITTKIVFVAWFAVIIGYVAHGLEFSTVICAAGAMLITVYFAVKFQQVREEIDALDTP